MTYHVLICARGGSQGLKNKNIKKFINQPLIYYTIGIAQKLKKVKSIILSTDSIKIASLAAKKKVNIPFLRPKSLAKNNTPEIMVWKHALNFIEKNISKNFKGLIVLPPTSPLRNISDIHKCIKKFETNRYDMVATITPSKKNPFFNMVKINNKSGTIERLLKGKNNIFRRQEAPLSYDLCTVSYIISPKFLKKTDDIYEGKIGYVEIPTCRAIDIDDKLDFQIAEFIYKSLK